VTVTTTRSRELFLHEIFTTAMEGGIQHWAGLHGYHWSHDGNGEDPDVKGFRAVLVPHSDEGNWGIWDDPKKDKAPLVVDIDVIRRGVVLFKQYAKGEIDSQGKPVPAEQRVELAPAHYWRQFLASERTNGDDGDYDADVADWIVQFGLFGQGVFG
jgi:hypothetical protein